MSKAVHYSSWALILLFGILYTQRAIAQIDNNGCVGANFGIDAGLYSGSIEYGDGSPAVGTADWFLGTSGRGTIDETQTTALMTLLQGAGDPTYEMRMKYNKVSFHGSQTLIDAVFARDNFGGTGYIDNSSFNSASKNGEDPGIWDVGAHNILGKDDLIDVAGHMLRDGTSLLSPLWFYGMINRAEPGGDAYMDFEFYIEDIKYTPGSGFNSGGPQMGHTAFTFDGSGKINKIGDFLYNVSLVNGGSDPLVEMRIWVSYYDYTHVDPYSFDWGNDFDGAFNGAPYGYASITPHTNQICGIVNTTGQTPLAPPWGTKNTKDNTWLSNYGEYAVVEVGVNMSDIGLDPAYIEGEDPCSFPYHTFMVKTRASAAFTAQLKDFAGPYTWGKFSQDVEILGSPILSCLNPTTKLYAEPPRDDMTYQWTTTDGRIDTDPTNDTIVVSWPGTYTLVGTLPTACPTPAVSTTVGYDPSKPFFNTPATLTTVSCSGNNGAIDLTVSGATPPYTYSWSNSESTQDINGLVPGTYTVTITDTWGCNISTAATIIAGTALTITPALTPATCHGYSNGAISLAVSGKSPFTYLWSNGNTTQNISNVGAGNYIVTVTDADGCPHTGSYTVPQPTAINITYSKTDDTDPNPVINNGSITLTVTGGTPDYTYSWSNAETTKDISALAYGSYTVTITDAHGCTGLATIFIYQPEICNDGIDNDGDGLTDCQDFECIPVMPGTITPGDPTPCTGDVITYTVPSNPAYDSYQWSVPGNATLDSGQGSTSITVTWNTIISGQVCVSGKKYECLSESSCITVTPHDIPSEPQSIIKN